MATAFLVVYATFDFLSILSSSALNSRALIVNRKCIKFGIHHLSIDSTVIFQYITSDPYFSCKHFTVLDN